MTRTDGVARQLYEQLSLADQLTVQRWRRNGHDWTTALLSSGDAVVSPGTDHPGTE